MPRTRPPYPEEFRRQIVELVKAGRTPEELSREFEPSAQTIHNWVKQVDLDAGVRSDGLTSLEREELRRLRRLAALNAVILCVWLLGAVLAVVADRYGVF